MSLFSHFKRFKSPRRKTGATTPVATEDRTKAPKNVNMDVAGSKLLFDPTKSEWAADGGAGFVHNDELRQRYTVLTEENNLLKVKVDLLLNILSKMLKDGDHSLPPPHIRSTGSPTKQTHDRQQRVS